VQKQIKRKKCKNPRKKQTLDIYVDELEAKVKKKQW
jgi:hypothetical protein